MLSRATVIQAFLDLFESPRYLEIGVNEGQTFHALQAGLKVAVDPKFIFEDEARQAGVVYHEVTSDEYFGSLHDGEKFDVVYIDGLHTFEQTLKDLLSAQLVLQERGVIVVDDVLPNSFDASLPNLAQVIELRQGARQTGVHWETDGSWMGDVYKLVFFVEQFMQQMSFATVADNHGQSVLWRAPRMAANLPSADYEAIGRLDFRDTVLRRSTFRLRPLSEIVDEVAASVRRSGQPADLPTVNLIPLPAETLSKTVLVQESALPMPRVSFPERMPELIRAFQESAWGTTRSPKTIEVHRLRNVCVVGQGVVFTKAGDILAETTIKMTDIEVRSAVRVFEAGLKCGNQRRYNGTHLLCGQAGIPNYGHWMVNILPIPFFMQQHAPDDSWTAYVPQMFRQTSAVVRDSLDLLGVGAPRRLEGDGQPAWFDELIVVTGLSHHGRFLSPASTRCLQSLAETVHADGNEKVWVSRVGEKRVLACEVEVNARLDALGWRILTPGDFSLTAQIAACKGAKVMAGIDGAGLTNLAFMPAGGRVTSFRPAQMPDTFFYELAAVGGLAYHDVCCSTSEPLAGDLPWDVTLQISAEEVLDLVA